MASLRNHSKTTFRVAIIGCGNIGSRWDEVSLNPDQAKTHAGAFSKREDCEIVGFLDLDHERASAASKFWKTGIATDKIEKIMELNPDIVCLCVPEFNRLEYLRSLSELESLVIVSEKPLCANTSEAFEILKLAAKKPDWKWIVNFIRRFSKEFQETAEIIHSKSLGTPVSASVQFGKGFRNSGSHALDLINWFFQTQPDTVQTPGVLKDDLFPTDPSFETRLEYPTRPTRSSVYFHPSDHRNFFIFEIEFLFSLGRIKVTDLGHKIEISKANKDLRYPDYQTLEVTKNFVSGLKLLFENMAEEAVALGNGKAQTLSALESAAQYVQICEAAAESIKQNSKVLHLSMSTGRED